MLAPCNREQVGARAILPWATIHAKFISNGNYVERRGEDKRATSKLNGTVMLKHQALDTSKRMEISTFALFTTKTKIFSSAIKQEEFVV